MSQEHQDTDNLREPKYDENVHLAESVAEGSVESWHRFLERYSGLIYSIVRRHIFTKDEDEIRNVYIDILKALYDGDISKYRGESKLSTWLAVYTKCRVLDTVRKHQGRHRNPRGYEKLSEFDRGVLRLYFSERLPLEIVAFILRWEGFDASADGILESAQRICDTVSKRYLERLDNEYSARRKGIDSVRTLRLLAHLRNEYTEKVHHERPDSKLLENEASEAAMRVRSALESLSERERKIIDLSARRIAEKMGINGERRVYTLIDKTIRKLRKSLQAGNN